MHPQKRLFGCSLILLLSLLGLPLLLAGLQMRQEQRNRALLLAIQIEDAPTVRKLLIDGANPNVRLQIEKPLTFWQHLLRLFDTLHGRKTPTNEAPSALMLSVVEDNTEIVRALLAKGASDVNAEGEFSEDSNYPMRLPLLAGAARNGNSEIVRALLDKGANINARSAQGETALILAASHIPTYYTYREETKAPWAAACKTHTAVVKLLLERGADVNLHENEENGTALYRAALNDATEMAMALVNSGADPNLGGDGWSVLDWAVYNSNLPLVKALLNKGAWVRPEEHSNGNIEPPLTVGGDANVARLLLDRGANVHAGRSRGKYSGETPLILAARYNDLDTLKLLLARGARVNETSYDGTALVVAGLYGDLPLIRYLIRKGARVNARSDDGETALINAAGEGKYENVKILLAAGANPNLKRQDGVTALMEAVRNGDEDVVRLILNAGANINARDKDGTTALKVAKDEDNDDVIDCLREAGAKE
ncbi:MAG TPA: ankyrin repeat domain-containing protein [Chthonomonadaceae bacterium]|nr:ankyrin repeat domain-containing protein [Chthonomonadaceae bacterium]